MVVPFADATFCNPPMPKCTVLLDAVNPLPVNVTCVPTLPEVGESEVSVRFCEVADGETETVADDVCEPDELLAVKATE